MKTIFEHDTEVALVAAAALINTRDATLDDFLRRWAGTRVRGDDDLHEVCVLRRQLRKAWQAEETHVVEIVNTLLSSAKALPQLVKHDDWDYHVHAAPRDASLATSMAVDAAMALADVVRRKELDRLQTCDFPTCGDAYVDLSKNRSRRFCDHTCANRAAVAAYRSRNASRK